MAKIDKEFHKLCTKILVEGREYEDKRRNVTRLQIPSYTFRHAFKDGFPAITSKKLYWKGIVTEAIWFLRGDNDIKYLNDNGVKIWNQDAYNWYMKEYNLIEIYSDEPDLDPPLTFEEFEEIGEGSVGQNYSVQWRNFNGNTDQISRLIEDMIENIMGSRLKVNAWNPSEIFETALPPCHSEFQVIGVPLTRAERVDYYATKENMDEEQRQSLFPYHTESDMQEELDIRNIPRFGFELHWNQRSVDTFLGLPFNIASYGLLAKILEKLTGYPALAIEGTLKCVHFYDNQYKAVKELLKRDYTKHKKCVLDLVIDHKIMTSKTLDIFFNKLKPIDFTLIGYTSDKSIKVDMLAPKKL